MLEILDITLPLIAAFLLLVHMTIFSYQTLAQPVHETTVPEALNILGLGVALAWFLYFWA